MKYYSIFIWGDVHPDVHGPFKSAEEREEVSKTLHREDTFDPKSGIYWADVDDDNGLLEMEAYSGAWSDEALKNDN